MVANLHQLIEPLGLLTRFQHQRHCLDTVRGKAFHQAVKMGCGDIAIGNDGAPDPGLSRPDLDTGPRDQSWANEDIVAALAKIDADCFM
jgi:hypothetical protein